MEVAPLRVRELKPRPLRHDARARAVAPLRVRELKQKALANVSQKLLSHPYGCVS